MNIQSEYTKDAHITHWISPQYSVNIQSSVCTCRFRSKRSQTLAQVFSCQFCQIIEYLRYLSRLENFKKNVDLWYKYLYKYYTYINISQNLQENTCARFSFRIILEHLRWLLLTFQNVLSAPMSRGNFSNCITIIRLFLLHLF